jgi:hypothetical protein
MTEPLNDTEATEVIPASVEENSRALELKHPTTPATLEEIAYLKSGRAMEVIDARVKILERLRTAALRITSPQDWLLFQDKEGREVGYLQDAGADRVRDLYGIEIFGVGDPVRHEDEHDEGEYFYTITGSGRCTMTRQTVENVQGGRASTEDFVQGKHGMAKQLDVMKAARANLDGGLTRELAGLKSVPVEELIIAWKGTHKDASRCRHGRGYRANTVSAGAEKYTDAPECKAGHGKMRLVPAGTSKKTGKEYSAFWSCDDRSCRETVQDSQWNDRVPPQTASPPSGDGSVGSKVPPEKVEAIETMRTDPLALEIIGSDGKSMEAYLGNLIIDDLNEADIDVILLKTKTTLEKYRQEKTKAYGKENDPTF